MIVWQFPKKVRIELEASGWWVYIKSDSFRFNSLSECLSFLAGRKVIKYDQIEYLLQATRRRYE